MFFFHSVICVCIMFNGANYIVLLDMFNTYTRFFLIECKILTFDWYHSHIRTVPTSQSLLMARGLLYSFIFCNSELKFQNLTDILTLRCPLKAVSPWKEADKPGYPTRAASTFKKEPRDVGSAMSEKSLGKGLVATRRTYASQKWDGIRCPELWSSPVACHTRRKCSI